MGLGAGANLALRLTAWRAERIAATAAFGGRGFGLVTAREIAQRINGVVRLGCTLGATSARTGILEAALCTAGVDFETEIYRSEPDWSGVIDLFGHTLHPGPGRRFDGAGPPDQRSPDPAQPLGDRKAGDVTLLL